MGHETPGFDREKLNMDSEEKRNLSDKDLRLQLARERNLAKVAKSVPGFMDKDIAGEVTAKIRDDAMEENMDRAVIDEHTLSARMDVEHLSAKENEALAAAQRKVEEAYNLIEESKREQK